MLYQHEDIRKIRATLALVFLMAYTLSLIALGFSGEFDLTLALSGALLLSGLLIGFHLGKRVRLHVPPVLARTAMLAIASISAAILLVKSIV